MDSQRPFLYLTLIFLGFMLWTSWQQYNAPKPVLTQNNAAAVSEQSAQQVQTSAASTAEVPNSTAVAAPSDTNTTDNTFLGSTVRIKTDVLDLKISTKGGDIFEADLPTYPVSLEEKDKPTRILSLQERNYAAQSGLLHSAIAGQDTSKLAPNHTAAYKAEQASYELTEGQDSLVVPLTWTGADGITVTKRYTFKRSSFLVDVEHVVNNGSKQLWTGTAYRQLKHGPAQSSGSFLTGVQAYVGGAYYQDEQYTKVSFSDMEEVNLQATNTGGWVAMLEHYFLSAWVPPQEEQNNYYTKVAKNLGVSSYILGSTGPLKQVAAGASYTFKSGFYVGPKDQDSLEAMAEGLDLTVDYGIFAFISKPIFWLMQAIHSLVGNWGWTIIFLTMLIKLIFFYPSAMGYKSMAKMKAVGPKMKEINERYAGKTDDASRQAKQKAMMDLYRKEKINPMGGCLPILIQIPVFMGLYWVLLESVELRQAPWMLWYEDLSIMDPYFVLPLIMGASMYVQQKLNPPQLGDPMQQKIFQFMPVLFTVLFLFFPAGLVLYWVVNNILSIAQQWYINNKVIGES